MLYIENAGFCTPNGVDLLRDVSLEVKEGTFVVVVGPNGAGKTTLLKLLSGELVPTMGSVYLHNHPMREYHPEQRAQMLGVLPQASVLSFPFSVFEVVMMGRIPHRRHGCVRKNNEIVWDALERLDAVYLADRLYPTLSGGEKQRVQMARVLAQLEGEDIPKRNKVLLLDEPTSALDLAHQHHLLMIARELANRGMAVLAILHDLNLAAQYADEVVVLHFGKVIGSGPVCEVINQETINHVYGVRSLIQKHPTMNRLVVSIDGPATPVG